MGGADDVDLGIAGWMVKGLTGAGFGGQMEDDFGLAGGNGLLNIIA
jgi:hypothetical protein